jgi:hypothetical protein
MKFPSQGILEGKTEGGQVPGSYGKISVVDL